MSKYLFIIQGEGRGHLTQAISLAEMLRSTGHEVVAVMVGQSSKDKKVPDFFTKKINTNIILFDSPSLAYGVKSKALDIRKTLINSILGINKFVKSLFLIRKTVRRFEPEIIINFYDVLAGIHQFVFRPAVPMVCIAHQYLLLHKDFVFPKNAGLDKFLVNLNTKITALNATKKLALSFDKFPNDALNNIVVVPPLLRNEVKNLTPQTPEKPFILAYMTIPSMAEELIKWHHNNQKIVVHCFWDKPQNKEEFKYAKNLTFHKINAEKFMTMMQSCAGLATTAGFESVCEAMSLGKPVMMIPVPKHFEQKCNAIDGERAGAGIRGEVFNLTNLVDFLPIYKDISPLFNEWQNQAKTLIINELEEVIYSKNYILETNYSHEFNTQINLA